MHVFSAHNLYYSRRRESRFQEMPVLLLAPYLENIESSPSNIRT